MGKWSHVGNTKIESRHFEGGGIVLPLVESHVLKRQPALCDKEKLDC